MKSRAERKSRFGRKSLSCLQCKHRKQRCDRQWPCNNCQRRQGGHLCQFGERQPSSAVGQQSGLPKKDGVDGENNAFQVPTPKGLRQSTDSCEATALNATDALKFLGYMDGGGFFGSSNKQDQTPPPLPSSLEIPTFIHESLHVVPPRPYTDCLVQNFFDNVNYHYGVLHQASFMTSYVDWWEQRRRSKKASSTTPRLVLACLVLRICANSTQYLSSELRETLEAELGDSVDNLGSRYQEAAQRISDFISPGEGGLTQVQQLFLSATWVKAEAEFAKSWHVLATAIREAQEHGMHLEDSTDQINPLEKELGNRVWCALFVWDCFMAAIFKRPPIIPVGTTIAIPDARLDNLQEAADDIPPPIVEKILQTQLAVELGNPDHQTVRQKIEYVERWMNSLPSAFRMHDPDRRWDIEYPRVNFQRLHLRMAAYMSQLLIVRPFLLVDHKGLQKHTASIEPEESHDHWVQFAIETSLYLMSTCKDFFDFCLPTKSKYFMVSFCPFDTAALLCSALLHVQHESITLHKREILQAIGSAQYMSRCLCNSSRLGATTACILSALVSRLELTSREREVLLAASTTGKSTGQPTDIHSQENIPSNFLGEDNVSYPDNITNNAYDTETLAEIGRGGTPMGINYDNWASTLETNNEALDLDLGVLEGVWDWEGLISDSVS